MVSSLSLPYLHRTVKARQNDALAVGRPGHGPTTAIGNNDIACSGIPYLNRTIASGSYYLCAIGRPGQVIYHVGTGIKGEQVIASRGIPHAHYAIIAARSDPRAIGRPPGSAHEIGVAAKGENGLARCAIPYLDRLIVAASAGDVLAVGRPGDFAHHIRMAGSLREMAVVTQEKVAGVFMLRRLRRHNMKEKRIFARTPRAPAGALPLHPVSNSIVRNGTGPTSSGRGSAPAPREQLYSKEWHGADFHRQGLCPCTP